MHWAGGCISQDALGRGIVYPSMHWAGGVYPSMHWQEGVYPGGCVLRGVCLWDVCPGVICPGGCLPRRCLPEGCLPQDLFLPRGLCGLPRRCLLRGCMPPGTRGRHCPLDQGTPPRPETDIPQDQRQTPLTRGRQPPSPILRNTVNKRVLRILLECILVAYFVMR